MMKTFNISLRNLGLIVCLAVPASAVQAPTVRVSVNSNAVQGNLPSHESAVSDDGRFVLFTSQSTNLVPGDTNGTADAFLRDLRTGDTTRISLDTNGNQETHGSSSPEISSDGSLLLFESASALVPEDTNGENDIYMRNRLTNALERLSLSSSGSQGNGDSLDPSLNADNSLVLFFSMSSNLVASDLNAHADVFVRDRTQGITEIVSLSASGMQGNDNSIFATCSDSGRFVVFVSAASNLVTGDTNGWEDIFVRDRVLQTTTRVSVSSNGEQATRASESPWISGNGRLVVFHSHSPNLTPGIDGLWDDVFLHDRWTGETSLVSVGMKAAQTDSDSRNPSLSRSGRFVSFESLASNIVHGDTNGHYDIFVRDLVLGTTRCASVDAAGNEGNSRSFNGDSITPDGRFVTFESLATNLVLGDTNGFVDVFAHDLGSTPVATYCNTSTNSLGCTPSLTTTGMPSVRSGLPFFIECDALLSQQSALLLYSTHGSDVTTVRGGTLCLRRPVRRTPLTSTGGSAGGGDCTGQFSFDFNVLVRSGIDSALRSGDDVCAQIWSRDPGSPGPASNSFSQAVAFVIEP